MAEGGSYDSCATRVTCGADSSHGWHDSSHSSHPIFAHQVPQLLNFVYFGPSTFWNVSLWSPNFRKVTLWSPTVLEVTLLVLFLQTAITFTRKLRFAIRKECGNPLLMFFDFGMIKIANSTFHKIASEALHLWFACLFGPEFPFSLHFHPLWLLLIFCTPKHHNKWKTHKTEHITLIKHTNT